MSKEMLHHLIDMVPDGDTDTIYKVLIKFIPEDTALPDEIQAIKEADHDISTNGTINPSDIDWN